MIIFYYSIYMMFLLCILLFVSQPQYEFRSTSSYIQRQPEATKTEYNINYQAGPRKVSGIDGWTLWLLWGSGHGVPSNASNDDLFGYYNYIQNGGTMNYDSWWNYTHAQTPIGDISILILFAGLYALKKMLYGIFLFKKYAIL